MRFSFKGLIPLCAISLSACFGPRVLGPNRIRYNSALNHSAQEQLLLNLVRLRYGLMPTFLEVNTISSAFNFGADSAVQAQFTDLASRVRAAAVTRTHSDTDVLGLSATGRTSEGPTISYGLIQGEAYAKMLLTPFKAEYLALLNAAGFDAALLLDVMIDRVALKHSAQDADVRMPNLDALLADGGQLSIETNPAANQLAVYASEEVPLEALAAATQQGLSVRQEGGRVTVSRPGRDVHVRIRGRDSSSALEYRVVSLADEGDPEEGSTELALQPRSLLGCMLYLARGVETPEMRHRAAPTQRIGPPIMIRCGRGSAQVSVSFGGERYYISSDDEKSLRTFTLLGHLAALQSAGGTSITPTLTLDVGPR